VPIKVQQPPANKTNRQDAANQSINYTFFQQERNPRREPLPNHYQWFPTGKAQTHKLGPDTAKTINAQALAWHVSQSMIATKP
jgi:hypothetical protein